VAVKGVGNRFGDFLRTLRKARFFGVPEWRFSGLPALCSDRRVGRI
jgi:hypothetical protein